MHTLPYTDLNTHLRTRFGCRVHKITVDAGMTCPNRDGSKGFGGCIYCNARGSGTGASAQASIAAQIRGAQPFLRDRYKAEKFIAYFQSFSNTYAPVERLAAMYAEALSVEDVAGLAVGTRPDCVPDPILDLLAGISARTYLSLELGLQSIHDRTLALINRGHTAAEFFDAVRRARERDIELCVHIILGLPGESREDMLETARVIGGLGIRGIKLHLQYVVRDTPLHRMYERGEYRCLAREEYVDILCDFLALLPPDMVIHRLTGDPHRDELIAPAWALEKGTNLQAVRNALHERNLRQGARCAGSRHG